MSERYTPTFQGEVQFRRYSDTSTQGASIVLALSDRDELSSFIGKEGRRFMAVLVEVGDDENPVEAPKPIRTDPKIGTIGYGLVMRCNEPEFWAFLNSEHDGDEIDNANDAALLVKHLFGVQSRKEIDGNPKLERFFHESIRGPYSKWLIRRGVTA